MVHQKRSSQRRSHSTQQRRRSNPHILHHRPRKPIKPNTPTRPLRPRCGFAARAHRELPHEVAPHERPAERGAVDQQESDGDEQEQEIEVIVAADAVVDPDAVVVGFLDAGATQRAVLRARRFGDVACAAEIAGVVEEVVVGIGVQGGVVGWAVWVGAWRVVNVAVVGVRVASLGWR